MKNTILLLLLTIALPGFSQVRYKVQGTFTDTTGKKAAEFVAVALLSHRDSSIVTSAISDITGHFELKNVPQGRYFIKTSHMGFAPLIKPVNVRGLNSTINIGILKLTGKDISLAEVVVKGQSKTMRLAKDTVEFNTLAFKPRENDVVEDLLKKLPGVQVDKDGAITVNGKAITQIMVDGKKFFLNDPKLASQNLPANIVEKIQLIDKKSDQAEFTKIDDGEKEKVINLSLKKDKKQGYFGNVRAGGGTNNTYDAGGRIGGFKGSTQIFTTGGYNNINTSSRGGNASFPNPNRQGINTSGNGAININSEISKQLNINGSYRYGYNNTSQETSSLRQNIEATNTYNSDRASNQNNSTYNNNMQARIEYKFDTTASILFSPNVQLSNGNSKSSSNSHQYSETGSLVNSENIETGNSSNSVVQGFDLLLRKKLKRERQTFSTNISYNQQDNNNDKYTNQENFYAASNTTDARNQHITSDDSNDSFSTRFTYTHPIAKYLTAEINNRISYRYSSSTNDAFDFNKETQKYDLPNIIYSQNTRNKRISDASGLRFVYSKSGLSINVGADLNLSKINFLNQRGTAWVDTAANYRDISPMAYIAYKRNESSFLYFSYRSNTNQPSINQIHPIQNPENPNNITIGNSNLSQEVRHSLSLNYNSYNKQNSLSFNNNTNFDFAQNSIINKNFRDEKLGKLYYQAVNVNGQFNINNYSTIGKSFFENKLQLNSSTNVGYSRTPGFINDIKFFSNQLQLGESLRGFLMLPFLEVGVDVGYNFSNAAYKRQTADKSIANSTNRYSSISLNGNVTAFLPAGFEVMSSYEMERKYGNSTSSAARSSLWNASLTKKFLKDKSLILSLLAFDILNQYKPFKRSVTANYIDETTFKTVSQTFMVSLSFNINKFGGMKMGSDRNSRRGGRSEYMSPMF